MRDRRPNQLDSFVNREGCVIKIALGCVVRMHFVLALSEGDVIEDTRGRPEPVRFTIGDDALPETFSKHLLGLKAGDRRTISLPADEAFGPHRPENIQQLPVSTFFPLQPEPGLVIGFQQGGGEIPGMIAKVDGPWATVDFNHPLAGREVSLSVEIFSVEPPGTQAISI